MGLSISVGPLADYEEDDAEEASWIEAELNRVNEVLQLHGLPEHKEPRFLPRMDDRFGLTGFPYSFIHELRTFYARCVDQKQKSWLQRIFAKLFGSSLARFSVTARNVKGIDDIIVDKIGSPKHHLIWHSDCEGYYLPIDFADVLIDESGQIRCSQIGSSIRLLEELIFIARPLGIELDDQGRLEDHIAEAIANDDQSRIHYIERLVWLSLYEAARLSIKHRAAIMFG